MKDGDIQLIDLVFEHQIWKKRLNLFLAEIDILINRNTNLKSHGEVKKLSQKELLELESQIENIITLKSKIEVIEEEFKYFNKDFPITEKHEYYIDHQTLRKQNDQILNIHFNIIKNTIKIIGI